MSTDGRGPGEGEELGPDLMKLEESSDEELASRNSGKPRSSVI